MDYDLLECLLLNCDMLDNGNGVPVEELARYCAVSVDELLTFVRGCQGKYFGERRTAIYHLPKDGVIFTRHNRYL